MKTLKALLLGSAAGLAAISAAQAADLPVKAKVAAQYVKICSLYGVGFYYIPGTDTCVQIGGYVRADYTYNGQGGGTPNYAGANGRQTRTDTSDFATRARAWVGVDARSQSAYGTVRSYMRIGFQNENQQGSSSPSIYFNRAFVQFAGFTFGRVQSPTDIFTLDSYQYGTPRIGADTDGNGVNAASYTMEFGGGLSLLLGIEERGGGRQKPVVNLATASSFAIGSAATNASNGERFPDFEGVLSWKEAWGNIGVFAVGHDASGGYYGATTTTGHPGDAIGWAAGIGGELKLPLFGPGDRIGAQFVYSDGAAGYATYADTAHGLYGSGNQVALGWITDGVYAPGTDVELTKVSSVTAGYEHKWSPDWATSIYGAYLHIDYSGNATRLICTSATVLNAATAAHCSPDYSVFYVGTRTEWHPVKDLSLGLDVMYSQVDTAFSGLATLPAAGARPAGIYDLSDQGIVTVTMRAQKNF
ncbi:MAG TPA: porin [Xanthobacteraceae bacterium]|jgi:hypothetical protein|nr:porin [Xanthobacteraceae bacterium]